MLLLALDTSTPAVGVAVCRDRQPLAAGSVVDARRHGEVLAVQIDAALRRAGVTPPQLDAVAVGVGPGPYTGLRVGLVTARSFGHALGVPVHGICSLDVLARAAAAELDGEFLVATDARRREVYWARYDAHGGCATRSGDPAVDLPTEIAFDGPVVGEGPRLYPQAFPDGRAPWYPDPVDLAALVEDRLAAGTPTLPPDPLYLRRPDAAEPGAAKRVLR